MKSLPPNQNALFLTRGGKLTLRNCSITVVNHHARPFTLVQTNAGERPARLRFERCLIRGAFDAAIAVTGGAADVFFDRTVVVNGQGGLVKISGADGGERRLFALRSVFAVRGAVLESSVMAAGRSRPLTFKALGTTFARLANPTTVPFTSTTANAAATDVLAWDGVSNEFAGWSSWLSAGVPATSRIDHLAAARTVWNNGDTESVESASGWNVPTPFENFDAEKLRQVAANRLDVLLAAAIPSPFLLEKTVDAFPRPTDPGVVATSRRSPAGCSDDAQAAPRNLGHFATKPAGYSPGRSRSRTASNNMRRPSVRRRPDVGNSLSRRSRRIGGAILAVFSRRRSSPEILSSTFGSPAAARFPSRRCDCRTASAWNSKPIPTRRGSSLCGPRRGGPRAKRSSMCAAALFRLVNFQLTAEGGTKLNALIRVDRGQLVLQRCRLRSSPGVESGSAVIRFRSGGRCRCQRPRGRIRKRPGPSSASLTSRRAV